MNGNAQFLQ